MTLPLKIGSLQQNADEEVRVGIEEYRGVIVLDVRTFAAFSPARAQMPTRRGISIRVEQLPDLVELLKDAVQAARTEGLIE